MSDAELRGYLQAAPFPSFIKSAEGEYLYANPAFAGILGMTVDEIVGRSDALLFPDFADRLRQNDRRVLETGETLITSDSFGTDAEMACTLFRIPFPSGEMYLGGKLRSLAEERRNELVQQEHRRVLENALGGVAFVTEQGWFTYANAEFARMLGTSADQMLGLPWLDVFADRHRHVAAAAADRLVIDSRVELEAEGCRLDGQELHLHCVLIPAHMAERAIGHYLFAEDVTAARQYERQLIEKNRLLEEAHAELERANARLRELSITDGLTGANNRREFDRRLDEEFREAKRYGTALSVVLLDVDHFKLFNDAFGHPAGDEVLIQVVRLVRSESRDVDVVARYGGEEFVVLLPQTDCEGALEFAERVRKRIESATWNLRPVTASIGCASLCSDTASPAALVASADAALYRSKETGRNRVTSYSP